MAPCCVGCNRVLDAPLGGPVCPACLAALNARLLPYSALPATLSIDWGRAAAEYDGVVRDVIHAFKYEGRRTLAPPLASLMRTAGHELLDEADCVVPVPLHAVRRLHRGFNQATELATHLGLPVVNALWRVRWTPAQMSLGAGQRRRNVRHAFRVAPWLTQEAHARFIQDRVVVLIDDVVTTGATLEACAHTLKGAGARDVMALTLAVTRAVSKSA